MRFRRPLPVAFREELYFQRLARAAEVRYTPQPYDGRVAVWRAEGLYFAEDLGWAQHVRGELVCTEIHGDQPTPRETMDEPHIAQLAANLRELLAPEPELVAADS
jgi:hypothetical protein